MSNEHDILIIDDVVDSEGVILSYESFMETYSTIRLPAQVHGLVSSDTSPLETKFDKQRTSNGSGAQRGSNDQNKWETDGVFHDKSTKKITK